MNSSFQSRLNCNPSWFESFQCCFIAELQNATVKRRRWRRSSEKQPPIGPARLSTIKLIRTSSPLVRYQFIHSILPLLSTSVPPFIALPIFADVLSIDSCGDSDVAVHRALRIVKQSELIPILGRYFNSL